MKTAPNKQPRSPAVFAKLEQARADVAVIRNDLGRFALEVAEGAEGGDERLADLRDRIATAEQRVSELEEAAALAGKLDRQADALGAAEMRGEQAAVMTKAATARLAALKTLFDALRTASASYEKYVEETNKMVVALPTGARLPIMTICGASWLGDLGSLIANEAWRISNRVHLPFARKADLTTDDPSAARPALDLMIEAQNAVLADVTAQMDRLNAEALANAERAA